jgi:hypothetical protein
MLKLAFSFNREPMNFIIKNKEIFYTDRRWGTWIRCMPPPENFMKAVSLSRNRIPAFVLGMFHFSEEEIKEYNDAKTEEELAQIIKRDAKSKSCIFVNSEKVEEPESEKPKIEEPKTELKTDLKIEGEEQNATERS